jgi:peroxiredoxin
MTTVLAGHKAPGFALPAMDGAKTSLADALKKGPVVIGFFKITCPVCQYTFPFLERLHRAYGTERATFWGISQDGARDTKDFCQEYGITFPALLDEKGYPVSNAYGLTTVPTVMLIGPDGTVRVSGHGFSRKELEKISEELSRLLKKPAAQVFQPDEIIPDYKPG